MENTQFLWWKMDSLVWLRGKTNQNRCILSVIMWPLTLPINIHHSRRSICLLLFCFFNLLFASLWAISSISPPLSLLLFSASAVCLTASLPSTPSASLQSAACSHSLQTFWAEQGQMGSGFWETHPPPTHTHTHPHTIIPHRLARSLHRSQHVHTYINTRVYMRTHSCSYAQESWERSFLASFCSGDAQVSPQWDGWGLWSDLKDIFVRPQSAVVSLVRFILVLMKLIGSKQVLRWCSMPSHIPPQLSLFLCFSTWLNKVWLYLCTSTHLCSVLSAETVNLFYRSIKW